MKTAMKRGVAAALAAGVMLAPVVAAVPVEAAGTAQTGVAAGTAGATAGTAAAASTATSAAATLAADTADVRVLTLEEVITRALDVNSNYKILEYTWRILELQEETQEEVLDRLPDENIDVPGEDINKYLNDPNNITIEDLIDALKKWVPALTDNPGMSAAEMAFNRDQLETALDKLDSQKRINRLQREEAREGVKLMVTQVYIGLLSVKQQLALVEASTQQQEQNVQNALLKYQLGLISKEAQEQEVRKLEDSRRNLDSLRIQYEKQLAQLLFLLDLPVDKKYDLATVTIDTEQSVEMPGNMDELVRNSFKVRQARESLRQVRLDYDLTEEYAPKTDAGDRQVDMADYQVKIYQEQVKLAEQTVRSAIDSLYRSAADAKAAYEQAQKKWQDASTDYQRMVLRYELGLIARQDLNNMDLALKQAQVQLEMAKYQYFLALKQLAALQAGYVPTTTSSGTSGSNGSGM